MEGSFDNTAGKVWPKGQTFTVLSPKMIKKNIVLSEKKNTFPEKVPLDT